MSCEDIFGDMKLPVMAMPRYRKVCRRVEAVMGDDFCLSEYILLLRSCYRRNYGKSRFKGRHYTGRCMSYSQRDRKNRWLRDVKFWTHENARHLKHYDKRGFRSGYNIDHIFPKSIAYEYGLCPFIVGGMENVRIITWSENKDKGKNITEGSMIVLCYWLRKHPEWRGKFVDLLVRHKDIIPDRELKIFFGLL